MSGGIDAERNPRPCIAQVTSSTAAQARRRLAQPQFRKLGKRISAHLATARATRGGGLISNSQRTGRPTPRQGKGSMRRRRLRRDSGEVLSRLAHRARTYELLAIASGKKSVGQDPRPHPRAYCKVVGRTNKADADRTGAEKPERVPELQQEPAAEESRRSTPPASCRIRCRKTPKRAARAKASLPRVRDIGAEEVNDHVCRLLQMTNRNPSRFISIGVDADGLRKLGTFFLKLVD